MCNLAMPESRYLLGSIAFFAILCSTPYVSCQSTSGPELLVFGDSISDTGVTAAGGSFARTVQTVLQTDEIFTQTPYSQGRFSNGPIWVNTASALLNAPLTNFAEGGATTGAAISQTGPLPAGFADYPNSVTVLASNLYQQVNSYFLASNSTANASSVVVIGFFGNDYFAIAKEGQFQKNTTADQVVNNIENAMETLYKKGARRSILATLFPIVLLPPIFSNNPALASAWTENNPLLKEMGSAFQANNPGSSVSIFDVEAITLGIITNPTQYGFTSSLPCYPVPDAEIGYTTSTPVCSNPSAYFSWDGLHPTTAAHTVIGNAFAQQFGYLWNKALAPVAQPTAGPTTG